MVNIRLSSLVLLAVACVGSTAAAQVRVVSWNVARLVGDLGAMEDVITALAEDDKAGFAVAPALMAFQEVTSSSRAALEATVAAAIPSVTYARATFTSSGSEDSSGGAQLLLYRSDLFTEETSGHADIFTGAGRRADRWKMRLNGTTDNEGVIWVYSMHLKASSGSSNQALRLQGATSIRLDAASLPSGSNVLYVGDYNVYSNNEPAYGKMTEAGTNRGVDPYGSGSWSGTEEAYKHTQSPRLQSRDLVGGGMDDRFDLQLHTPAMGGGGAFSLIGGTYRSLGNDGNHYNDSINFGTNSYYPSDLPRSNALADDLFEASDHIPVISDFTIPGMLSCVLENNLGRVIANGTAPVELLVTNARAVVDPDAASALAYSYSTDALLDGEGSGVAPLFPSFDTVVLNVASGTEGDFYAFVEIDAISGGVGSPSYTLSTNGTALRESVPSFSARAVETSATLTGKTASDVGVVILEAEVFNHGWNVDQALLDVDAVSGLGDRFFAIDGFESGVGSHAVTLRFGFLSDGADDGVHQGTATIHTTDEDVPGESSSTIVLSIQVTVGASSGNPADFNGDGRVDGADLGLLLASWGKCPAPCAPDLTGDGTVDGADLGLLLAAWQG